MRKYTTDEYIAKCREVWGDTYDLSNVVYKNSKEKVTVICYNKDILGKEHGKFYPLAGNFIKGHGCPYCLNKATSKELFVEKAKEKHNNKYTYNNVNFINSKEKVFVTCPIHGDFKISPNNHLKGEGCPKCSKKHRYTNEEIVNILKEIHGDKYDYCVENGIDIIYYTNKELFNEYCKNGYFSKVFHDKKELLDYINSK